MAKKWTAFKRDMIQPLEWMRLDQDRVVFYMVESMETIQTPEGPMLAVKLRNAVDLANPEFDVAGLVGRAVKVRRSGKIDPQSPELWYWQDKFWMKAVDSGGNDYYNNKCYLFYEVEIQDPDTLLGGLRHHWQGE